MRALSVEELLSVWEQATKQLPVEQSLALLQVACPETPSQELLNWTIGTRDAALLTLRDWTFGSQLNALAQCLACGERLELTFESDDIRVSENVSAEVLVVSAENYVLKLRVPTVQDLLALETTNTEAARKVLLERCILEAQHEGEEVVGEEWPEAVQAAAVAAIAQNDRQADVQLALSCPQCGHQWQANFDIGAYFWDEIEAWALRLLREVHLLAATYGWREADILALSPLRRQFYLEMLTK